VLGVLLPSATAFSSAQLIIRLPTRTDLGQAVATARDEHVLVYVRQNADAHDITHVVSEVRFRHTHLDIPENAG
jgi:hypothetical protein